MKEKFLSMLAFSLMTVMLCSGQAFEGSISFRTIHDGLDRTLLMKVKADKTVLEVMTDSNELVRVIKDYGSESTTLLRSRDDLKFGFRLPTIQSPEVQPTDGENKKNDVIVEATGEIKMIGSYECRKIKLKSAFAEAEGWISSDVKFSLSRYFPEFLGSGVDPELRRLRVEADVKGFIMAYHEVQPNLGLEKTIEVTLDEKEIADEAFLIPPGFIVLDEQGMVQLFTDAQYDDVKKKQWEEFHGLFGKK